MDFWENIKNFTNNQSWESNCNNLCHRFILEQDNTSEHYNTSLKNRFPHPDQESLNIKNSSLLKRWIKNGEFQYSSNRAVLISNKWKNREHCINSRVSKNKIAIVNGNSDKVKNNTENSLNNGNNKPSMNNKLTKYSTPLVTLSSMP